MMPRHTASTLTAKIISPVTMVTHSLNVLVRSTLEVDDVEAKDHRQAEDGIERPNDQPLS